MIDEKTTAIASDEWNNAGAFHYRILPKASLGAFFTGGTETMRIEQDRDKWWVTEDRRLGATPYPTLQTAKAAADADIAERERTHDATLLKLAGLDCSTWRVNLYDGIDFVEIDGNRWIEGDTMDGMPGQQRWNAYRGNVLVACGLATVREALDALS